MRCTFTPPPFSPRAALFDRRQQDAGNLQRIFGITEVPCDTRLRELLDPVDPELLRPLYRGLFAQLQRGKALEPLAYYDGHYLLSLDGTGSYNSEKVASASCLVKKHRNGRTTYYQQVLGAADLKGSCTTAIAKTTPTDALDTRAQVADLIRMKNPADSAYGCSPARFVRAIRAALP